jgi:SWI/SNF-related matrix-associated actin-dependent regulator of chromatin subfamily A3
VIRFAMENSVEERVLVLQEKKREMADEAFGERGTQKDKLSKSVRHVTSLRLIIVCST